MPTNYLDFDSRPGVISCGGPRGLSADISLERAAYRWMVSSITLRALGGSRPEVLRISPYQGIGKFPTSLF